jgi:hypothetical protein
MNDLLDSLGRRAVTRPTALKALRAAVYDVRGEMVRELWRAVWGRVVRAFLADYFRR